MIHDLTFMYPNRTICSVLEEMRKCFKTYNFAPIPGLIEEAQSLANRMESGLGDVADIREWSEKRRELKKEIRQLKEQIKLLKTQLPKEKEDEHI